MTSSGFRPTANSWRGTTHLVASGVANPVGIGIAGISYGGYSALAGAVFTPDLYACAVKWSLGSVRVRRGYQRVHGGAGYFFRTIGEPGTDALTTVAPARAAENFRAPVLLVHGAMDSVTTVRQSATMARALRQAGRPVAFIQLEDEDHGLSTSASRQRVLEELEKFLDRCLKPAG